MQQKIYFGSTTMESYTFRSTVELSFGMASMMRVKYGTYAVYSDHYATLGVQRSATQKEIKEAYIAQCKTVNVYVLLPFNVDVLI